MIQAGTIVDAILRDALQGVDEVVLIERLGERLRAAGVPLMRMAVICDFLDPMFDSHGVYWTHDKGGHLETYRRDLDPTADGEWQRSPFRALVTGGESRMRRRLGVDHVPGEFPVLDEFRARGATDYLLLIERVGPAMAIGDTRGVIASWLCDDPAGFRDEAIELLVAIMPALSTAFLGRTMHRTARVLLGTYLGQDAAERVLAGNVVRGRAEPLRAVVWFADLVGFTRIADTTAGDVVLAMLNEYAEAEVDAIESHGGHVLKFIGDGLLAIFPGTEDASACVRALDAAVDFRARIAALNDRRAGAGQAVTDAHVALHIGEVLYGNVGSPRRLDFTVLGAAVNEAARIEALCGSLDQRVIVSSAFAQAAGDARSRLVSLGRYAMKGVAKPQELFTLDGE